MTFRTRASLLVLAFAMGCTTDAATPAEGGVETVRLGERARFGALAVTPLRVEEDSRCPASVQCIQAGTVRIAVRIVDRGGARDSVLHLRTPLDLGGGHRLTLAAACPYPRTPGEIPRSSYRFTLVAGEAASDPAREAAC